VFLERLSSDLVTRGHQNLVACLSPTPSRHGNETLQVHEFGLRNIYWPFDGTRHKPWLKAVWHLRNAFGRGSASYIDSLLASEKPDLVHTHNLSGITSAVWQTIGARGIPLIHTIHDYALLCPSATMFRRNSNCATQCLDCRFLSWSNQEHSRFVDAVVGVSDFVLEQHVQRGYFPRASRHVIHNGNPSADFPSASLSSKASTVLRVGYLGRLAPSKGIEVMLDALTPLVPERCQVSVAGAGSNEYETTLKSRYEARGVRFVGRVDSSKFLADIDVLVTPSLWNEPFGLVLCEAMSAGVPVVASAVGGIPEIVEHGRCGFLFEPGDGDALRNYVVQMSDDRELHGGMSRFCQQKAAKYRFERTVDSYLRVYDQTQSGARRDVACCHH
jgi:glycosyltransferase involved in cell wall biosynthesis